MKRFLVVIALVLPVAAIAASVDGTEFMFIKHLPGFAPSGYVDVSGPQAVSRSPENGATGVSTGALVHLVFDENVNKGSGDIVISESGVEFERVAVLSGAVLVSGKEATIDPVSSLARGKTYAVSVPTGAFEDARGNASVAVSGWSFETIENNAPSITSLPLSSVMEGTPYSYFLTAEDVEGDTLSFSFSGPQPAWLNLDDYGNGTATLWGTPQEDDVGGTSVALVVSDGTKTAEQAFTIAVAANGTPVFTSSIITQAREGELYSYFAMVDDSLEDSLSITPETLPGWLIFTADNENRMASLEGTPMESDVGNHTVALTVSDGLKSSTQSFTITVAANPAPSFSSAGITEGREGLAYVYSVTVADADAGDTLAIAAPTLPSWLDFTDHMDRTGTLSGTPGVADIGNHTVALTVSDGLKTAQQNFTISIFANDGPVWASPAAGTLSGTFIQGQGIVPVTFVANDTDVPVTYTVAAGSLPAGLALNGNVLEGTPTGAGDFSFTIMVSDNLGANNARSFDMVVQDITPNAFSFNNVTGAALSSVQTSNAVAIAGITGNVTISVAGGSYNIDGGSYITSPGTIHAGQVVTVRQTSSAALNTATTTTLTIGTVSSSWTVTTLDDPCIGNPSVGAVCADGTVYAGISPDGNLPMYVTRCDAGQSWDGSACAGTRSVMSWGTFGTATNITNFNTGEANTAALAALSDTLAAKYCQNLDMHGKDDWYLPARAELIIMYNNGALIGGFDLSNVYPNIYWSSSECYEAQYLGKYNAWGQRENVSCQGDFAKIQKISVRCARR